MKRPIFVRPITDAERQQLEAGVRSSRPHTTRTAFPDEKADQLRTLLHQSPRTFDKPTSRWTLELAAEVSFQQGLTPEQVSGETIRATLARLGVRWQRAKAWITSPDPAYARKRGSGPADSAGGHPSGLGLGVRGRELV